MLEPPSGALRTREMREVDEEERANEEGGGREMGTKDQSMWTRDKGGQGRSDRCPSGSRREEPKSKTKKEGRSWWEHERCQRDVGGWKQVDGTEDERAGRRYETSRLQKAGGRARERSNQNDKIDARKQGGRKRGARGREQTGLNERDV